MPGIYGFSITESNSAEMLEKMTDAMYLYDYFKKDELFSSNQVSASRVHLGKIGEQNSPLNQNDVSVWIEGEVYNLSEIEAEFGLAADISFAEALVKVYLDGKLNQFLNKIDGYFCAALFDAKAQNIKLISDRYGMRMLYWYFHNDQFAWASEVKGILALNDVDKTIDPTSFDCFMDLGYLLGEHTWFEQIKLINPATVLTFDLNQKSIHQEYYWKWSEIKPSRLTFDQAVDELGHRFIKAVKRRFNPNEKIGIALSGGLDSRAIFAAVHHLYPDYKGYAFTFGVDGCDDITIAKQVVRKTDWDYKEFHFTDKNWFEPRIEKVWNTDGMKDMMHMHGGEFIDEVSSHIDVNLNGYLGDAIFGGSYFKNGGQLNKRICKNLAVKYYGPHIKESFVTSDFFDIDHIDPYLFMSRGRRLINMGTVNGLIALDQRKPFFDNECVELIFSLPDEYRLNNKLYAAMLQKFFPEFFKSIPWQKTGKPAAEHRVTLAKRAFNKGLRILKSLLGSKDTKNYTDYAQWIRSEVVANQLIELLDSKNARYTQLATLDLKEKFLMPHLNNKVVNHSNEILRIATIELYLRQLEK